MVDVLSKGVLPCFAGEGDSAPDRLVSSTVALTFAACGLRVFGVTEDDGRGSHITVTSAGLLYCAAWYVLVYAGAVHMQPTLKKRLTRNGSDADRHLCSALCLDRETAAGSVDQKVCFDWGEIAQALRIVFGDLLDVGTILRAAELYVPELLAKQLSAKKLNRIPDSVRSSIESRDVWFVNKLMGELIPDADNDPPVTYLGNLAHGLHSSIQGTLTKSRAKPIAQALHGLDSKIPVVRRAEVSRFRRGPGRHKSVETFANIDGTAEEHVSLESEEPSRVSVQHESEETFVIIDDRTENPVSRYSVTTTAVQVAETFPCLDRRCQSEGSTKDPWPLEPEHVRVERGQTGCRRLCKGLWVASVDKLGFRKGHLFLTTVPPSDATQDLRWTSALAVKNPCLINIASTMYRKIRDKVAKVTTCSNAYPTLIMALWVLFMRSNSSPASTAVTEASAHYSANAAVSEPSTPEALAVMVHLAVQMLNLETNTDMRACNDIKAMYSRTCYAEAEFILVTAITGGLFGVNVKLRVDGSFGLTARLATTAATGT
ncbi:hypothetical protein DPEC_G00256230 [Dallia pectoralis]|uniref:Uncharacterized protein n=1 Tax=Dallia pectoralis TaxID=75939 RepID=A0ACC2FUT1_DALPE|nr:hypothetical protein DPEC_G00256230 [Dallia pectoralis]